MKSSEKISALIDAYIELAQNHHYNDSQIIDSLADIFDEEELVELGYGDFVHDYFHDNEEETERTAPLVEPLPSIENDISKIAYALYKQDWVDCHTTPWQRLQSIREYHDYVQECHDEGETPMSYEEYLFDYGFQGSLYVCYEEFCDEEYHDIGYIKHLLGDDEGLLERYYADLDAAHEENEALSIVADVLSEAESKCLAGVAHENAQIEQILD